VFEDWNGRKPDSESLEELSDAFEAMWEKRFP
jgi:hypothetical protein